MHVLKVWLLCKWFLLQHTGVHEMLRKESSNLRASFFIRPMQSVFYNHFFDQKLVNVSCCITCQPPIEFYSVSCLHSPFFTTRWFHSALCSSAHPLVLPYLSLLLFCFLMPNLLSPLPLLWPIFLSVTVSLCHIRNQLSLSLLNTGVRLLYQV